jgi:hypothetical protein
VIVLLCERLCERGVGLDLSIYLCSCLITNILSHVSGAGSQDLQLAEPQHGWLAEPHVFPRIETGEDLILWISPLLRPLPTRAEFLGSRVLGLKGVG